jgi:predicted glycosyltransferase
MVIANALVERHKGFSVLILSGSPIIGSFDFRARVDFVRVPGVIKLRNGEYTSLSLHISLDQTLELRESIIRHTANVFDPDLFIVDKEPLGLHGEVAGTLAMLKARGTALVLGLRDVMDEPSLLAPEWEHKRVMPALRDIYDEIWIYGRPEVYDPLAGVNAPPAVRDKMVFTGYLRRSLPAGSPAADAAALLDKPYILVTPGGGNDGEELVDWVIAAYEHHAPPSCAALVVFGPFMPPEIQARFKDRITRLDLVTAITFDAHFEHLMAGARGVVAMGGYNTFCEILSFDRPAILCPRTVPRLEQMVRAQEAERLGLVKLLPVDQSGDPAVMAQALNELSRQPPPSDRMSPELLDGLEVVDQQVMGLLGRSAAAEKAVAP